MHEGLFRRSRRWTVLAVAALMTVMTSGAADAAVGNIHPLAIEIDSPSANLYPGGSTVDCPNQGAILPSGADWVADCAANTDTPSLVDSVATGLMPNVTSRTGGFGNWRGVRIVDGVAGGDQDIFLKGGKENDTSTWTVGPGSVGSSKYDVTQAYLANNQTTLFFGMERRGNNGTTAFDFEFNQDGAAGGYIPTRTDGDVLFTFEVQGAGNSGSATPFYFTWSTALGKYDGPKPLPAGVVATINTNTTTPAAPWGHVDSSGNWTDGNFERFEFAEAKVPLSLLPGVNACSGGEAFVQVRSRSAATDTSDLKDTTKIFNFNFGAPTAAASLGTNCSQQFTYSGAGSSGIGGGSVDSYAWQFDVLPTTATLSGGGVSATATAGRYSSTQSSGTVNVTLPSGVASAAITAVNTVTAGGCQKASPTQVITVYRTVAGSVSLTPDCDGTFAYAASGSGGKAPYSYAFTLEKLNASTSVWQTATTFTGPTSGTLDINTASWAVKGEGDYRLKVTISDSQTPACTVSLTSNTITVKNALNPVAAKGTPDATALTVPVGVTVPAGSSVQWQRWNGTSWVNIAGANGTTLTYSTFETDATPTLTGTFVIASGDGSGTYVGKVWTVLLRAHVSRTVNGNLCEADSNAVTVKKVTAVDP